VAPDQISDLLKEVILTTFAMAAPVLFAGLIVGFVISIFQAATQIQEVTLVFIPKMIAAGLVLWLAGPWIFERLSIFIQHVAAALPAAAGGM
jgi:flagellar biosynthetic protein FliQ